MEQTYGQSRLLGKCQNSSYLHNSLTGPKKGLAKFLNIKNSIIGMVGSVIMEHISPEEVPNNNITGYGIKLNTEIKRMIYKKFSLYWEANMDNGTRNSS